ncbi:MAG: cyclodeaminase/cyclohydrolase family protein [Planctomycetota bacterium]
MLPCGSPRRAVTGSELVVWCLWRRCSAAGRHFLAKQQRSLGVSDRELIHIAVRSMGLDSCPPSSPKSASSSTPSPKPRTAAWCPMTLAVTEVTASEAPAPGGGSVSALVGALGAALATMVANLSSHKRGWDERWLFFSEQAERGKALHAELLALVDEDTRALRGHHERLGSLRGCARPQPSKKPPATRSECLRVMAAGCKALEVAQVMAKRGMKASASDVAVGALCAPNSPCAARDSTCASTPKDLKDETARSNALPRPGERARSRARALCAQIVPA